MCKLSPPVGIRNKIILSYSCLNTFKYIVLFKNGGEIHNSCRWWEFLPQLLSIEQQNEVTFKWVNTYNIYNCNTAVSLAVISQNATVLGFIFNFFLYIIIYWFICNFFFLLTQPRNARSTLTLLVRPPLDDWHYRTPHFKKTHTCFISISIVYGSEKRGAGG